MPNFNFNLPPNKLGKWFPDIIAIRAPKIEEAKIDDIPSLASLREAIRKLLEMLYALEGRNGPITFLNDVTILGDLIINNTTLEEFITNIINNITIDSTLAAGSWRASAQTFDGSGIVWDTEITNDTDFYTMNGSNKVLTIVQDGIYHISGSLENCSYNSGITPTLRVKSDGGFSNALELQSTAVALPAPFLTNSWSVTWEQAAGDTLIVEEGTGGGADYTLDQGFLSIIKVA